MPRLIHVVGTGPTDREFLYFLRRAKKLEELLGDVKVTSDFCSQGNKEEFNMFVVCRWLENRIPRIGPFAPKDKNGNYMAICYENGMIEEFYKHVIQSDLSEEDLWGQQFSLPPNSSELIDPLNKKGRTIRVHKRIMAMQPAKYALN